MGVLLVMGQGSKLMRAGAGPVGEELCSWCGCSGHWADDLDAWPCLAGSATLVGCLPGARAANLKHVGAARGATAAFAVP